MEETKTCPKCNSKMEKGLMLNLGSTDEIRWQKGELKKWRKWTNISDKLTKLPRVDSYKCVECGYIESYVK